MMYSELLPGDLLILSTKEHHNSWFVISKHVNDVRKDTMKLNVLSSRSKLIVWNAVFARIDDTVRIFREGKCVFDPEK